MSVSSNYSMKVAIIGRTEVLYDAAVLLENDGHEITSILTAKEAPEYSRTANDFKALAEEFKIPFAQGAKIIDHMEFLDSSGAEIGVSVNYPGIIPQSIIDLFPLGILNAHGGDLPRYRGNACQAWAILNGENRIGLCVHKMIGGELDSGNIIARDYLNIDQNTKVTKCWEWIAERAPPLFLQAVDQLERDPQYVLECQSKETAKALRCYPRRPEDGRINWDQSALQILRLINASNKPYDGAFCEYAGGKMIIWDAEMFPEIEPFCALPGQVMRLEESHADVATLEGVLRIKVVQFGDQTGAPIKWIKSIRSRLQ